MSGAALSKLRALNERFIRNFVTNDVEAHDAIIHPWFICLMPNGAKLDRETYLKYWATAFDPDQFAYWDYRDEQISLFGNVALVRSANKYVRRANGAEQAGMTVYTDTYLEENGDWLCIQAQITPLAPEHYPADDTIVRSWIHGRMEAA